MSHCRLLTLTLGHLASYSSKHEIELIWMGPLCTVAIVPSQNMRLNVKDMGRSSKFMYCSYSTLNLDFSQLSD
jgi:hypothetical protein